ncbi:MAG: hypothetical protein U9N85_12885 [Bacteroidota bacterium]|nr:hypothetical protein [Bacteroidota bacterium]
MKKSIYILSITLLFVALALNSCDKEPDTPPVLPPESSLIADFSDFNDSPDKATYANFGYSVTNVMVWNVFITVGLAIPVASYAEAVQNHEPVYQSNETWLWSFDFSVLGITHTADLYGSLVNDSSEWKMYISKEGVCNDFLWYKGKSALNNSGGYWIMYESQSNDVELLQIDWESNGTSGNIRYTNIKKSAKEINGYILYGNDNTEGEFSNYYTIYNSVEEQLTEIEWDKASKAGHVRDTTHFEDQDWHCWNENLEDIDCE